MPVVLNPFTGRLQLINETGGGGNVVGDPPSVDKAIPRWVGVAADELDSSNIVITDSDQMLGDDGSLANPAYSFGSDDSFGMYFNTDTLYLVGNGNSAIELDCVTTLATHHLPTYLTETFEVDDIVTMNSGQVVKVTGTAASLVITDQNFQILVTDTSAPRTITLPAAPATGQQFRIKDASGGAGTNNITVDVTGGVITIDGATSQVINIDYGFMTVVFDGTNYFIVG